MKAAESLLPTGCGQCEQVTGDRQTGKTPTALDAIINQKCSNSGTDEMQKLHSIYTAVGQRGPTGAQLAMRPPDAKAVRYTIVASATLLTLLHFSNWLLILVVLQESILDMTANMLSLTVRCLCCSTSPCP